MPEDRAVRPVHLPRIRPHTLALSLLFLGLAVSLALNLRQSRKTNELTSDVAALRQQSESEIAELRQAQSASLEQDLLRLDELSTQLQKNDQDEQDEAVSLSNKIRSELAKTVEQRHQEMITAISDLRADLRTAASVRAASVSDLSKPAAGPAHATTGVQFTGVAAADPPAVPAGALVSSAAPSEEQITPLPAKKKSFWSKLNPFGRSKNKKQENTASSSVE